MTIETVARTRIGPVTRLTCHPRLPLFAGVAAERPEIHIWDEHLNELGTVVGDWSREIPAVAWHPYLPSLVVADKNGVFRWTADGVTDLHHFPYWSLAFSPDGERLWASPSSSGDEYSSWETSDVIGLTSGTVDKGPRWDTGVAVHPAGGLVATLCSDQGATLCVFARPDHAMRVLRRALILDADGYETPIFSPDGRYLAIRGNAYDNSVDVFEFPSLRRVLTTILGEPNPGCPYPDEWLDQLNTWSRHNIAFGADPGTLWVGTPTGTLVEVDIDNQQAVEHDMLGGSPVTALCATPTGALVVATGAGDLVHLAPDSTTGTADAGIVRAFLDSTSEIPADGDLEESLDITDGTRTWTPDDRATVTTAESSDPGWLQITAAMNKRGRSKRVSF